MILNLYFWFESLSANAHFINTRKNPFKIVILQVPSLLHEFSRHLYLYFAILKGAYFATLKFRDSP